MLIPNEKEKEFIYSCIFNNYLKENFSSSKSQINIKKIISIFKEKRVEHIILNNLHSKSISNDLPGNFFYEIRESYLKRSITTLKIIKKNILLSDLLSSANIDHVFLKGIGLCSENENYLRPMRDIDILVHPNDIHEVVHLAKNLNFRFRNNEIVQLNDILINSTFYDLPIMLDDNGVPLEIHYRITTNEKTCKLVDKIFESKRQVKVHGHYFFVPSPETLFTHLIFHASKKANFDVGIFVLGDLIKLIQIENVDKKEVLKLSKSVCIEKISKMFFELIEFSKDMETFKDKKIEKLKEILILPIINTKITDVFIQENIYKSLKKIKETIFVPKIYLQREFGKKQDFLFRFYLFKRWKRQLKVFGSLIFFSIKNFDFVVKRTKIVKELFEK